MPLFSFEGKSPRIHPTAFIAPTATHHRGRHRRGERLGLVQRRRSAADFSPIVIRRGANVQDCAVIHVTPVARRGGGPGRHRRASLPRARRRLGEEALVGNSSTVLDGARIGVRAMVAAGSLVTPDTEIPDGMLAMGAPCKVKGPLAGTAAERWVQINPAGYQALAQRHRAGVKPL